MSLNEQTTVRLPVAVAVTVLFAVVSGVGGAVAGGYQARELILRDMRTETTERLKAYVTREEQLGRFSVLEIRLARIEEKMDLLLERRRRTP